MKEGWTTSQVKGYEWFRVFTAPKAEGHVTVDYKNRVWRFGISYHGPTRPVAERHEGRGWRVRLEEDAMRDLERVLKGHDDIGESNDAGS